MKLIFCPECGDTFALEWGYPRECNCGKSKGFYSSSVTAVVNGHGVIFAINNYDLAEKGEEWLKDPSKGQNLTIECYTIPMPMDGHVVVKEIETENYNNAVKKALRHKEYLNLKNEFEPLKD